MKKLQYGKITPATDLTIDVKHIGHGMIRTLETVVYVDRYGYHWEAPEGIISDGYSIPRFAWRVAGHPFSGRSIIQAVIHDHFCNTKVRSHKATHRVFEEMMYEFKEKKFRAFTYSKAVKLRGPRWKRGGK